MPKFGKKKSYVDWLYTRPVLVFLVGLIILMSFAVFQRLGIERDMYARRIEAEQKHNDSVERKTNLEDKVQYFEGDRGIEEEIRKNFDVAREGETVVILMGEEILEEDSVIDKGVEEKKWYQFWK